MYKDTCDSGTLSHKKMLEVEEIFWGSITCPYTLPRLDLHEEKCWDRWVLVGYFWTPE